MITKFLYYVATIDKNGKISFDDIESMTKGIDKEKVTELYNNYIQKNINENFGYTEEEFEQMCFELENFVYKELSELPISDFDSDEVENIAIAYFDLEVDEIDDYIKLITDKYDKIKKDLSDIYALEVTTTSLDNKLMISFTLQ